MSYILVTADFPDITSKQRNEIYECLDNKNIKKIHEHGRDIDTVWQAYFSAEVSENRAIEIIKKIFDDCCERYCNPKLVIHWGPNKPTKHGLV